MKLEKIIHLEESLLLCENDNKFTMPFIDYLTLDSFLSYIERITNIYFQLVTDYQNEVNNEAISLNEKKNKINEYSNKLLQEEVNIDLTSYNEFIEKYKIISDKQY